MARLLWLGYGRATLPRMEPMASVIVATKNRAAELETCLGSVVGQSVPLEIIVNDDGSTDDTAAMVATKFPAVRYLRSDQSRGVCVARNRLVKEAQCEIVVSLDDDAAFSTALVVEQTLLDLTCPRIAAVGIPYIDVRRTTQVNQLAVDADQPFCLPAFIGTAFAIRRSIFLEVGGFREYVFHQGEERDLCMRLYSAGYCVRAGRSDPIHHFESPKRDTWVMDVYGRRNDILFAWSHVPRSYLLPYLGMTTLNGLKEIRRKGEARRRLFGLARGYLDLRMRDRQPVSAQTYRTYREMKRRQLPLDEVLASLDAHLDEPGCS